LHPKLDKVRRAFSSDRLKFTDDENSPGCDFDFSIHVEPSVKCVLASSQQEDSHGSKDREFYDLQAPTLNCDEFESFELAGDNFSTYCNEGTYYASRDG
jgi:hypothetical protein